MDVAGVQIGPTFSETCANMQMTKCGKYILLILCSASYDWTFLSPTVTCTQHQIVHDNTLPTGFYDQVG